MITRRVLHLVSAVCVLAFAASGASASILAPGATSQPPDTTLPLVPINGTPVGTALATSTTNFTSTANSFTGTLTQAVYRNQSGSLDFFYQFTNNGPDSIEHLTVANFTNVLVDAGFVASIGTADSPFTAGTYAPIGMDRSVTGKTIAFDFTGFASVPTGGTSQILFAVTDATTFHIGTVSLIDSGTATVLGFAPLPEASTMAGFGLLFALGGIGMLRLRRRGMDAASA